MLQAIREKAQGWIAWAIVILITIPFALWGIQEYIGVGGEAVVAKVDGSEISEQALDEQTRQTRERLRTNLGTAYRADLFPEAMLRRQTLDRMIDEQVLQRAALDWGMRASDQMVIEAIRTEQAFQIDGQFNNDIYRTILRNNALSESAYEESVRLSMTVQQLQFGIAGSAFATKSQVDGYQRLRDQTRTVSYVTIPAESFLAAMKPDEAEVAAYYQAHQARYQVPERVKLDYLLLDLTSLAEQIPVDAETVRAWYEQHKNEFVAPEERHLRHILISVAGDDAVAKAKAQSLHDQIVAGADFAALAKAESADPGSAPEGGDLGWVSIGMMVPDFEKAAFALTDGALSEPVKSPFGYHLIQVVAVRGGGADASFDQVAEKATEAYRRAEAERLFYERSERLAELTYETPDSLVQAAETLGLTLHHSDWLDASGGEGDLSSPKVTSAAFSNDVLVQGHNSEMLELGPEKLLVLRVAEHEVARSPGLTEVHAQVLAAVRVEQAAAAAKQAGEAALADARANTSLKALADDNGWSLRSDVVTQRDQTDVPSGVREQAFSLPRPTVEVPQLAGTELSNGDYVVLALSAVTDGDPAKLDDTGRELLTSRLTSLQGRMDLGSLGVALRDRADVSVMLKSDTTSE